MCLTAKNDGHDIFPVQKSRFHRGLATGMLGAALLLSSHTSHAGTGFAPIDLTIDARKNLVTQNPVQAELPPGNYIVTAIKGGWSAWPVNTGCNSKGVCDHGYQAEWDMQSPSIGYLLVNNKGINFATPTQALSHAEPVVITLTATEKISFGVNDCKECLADNRDSIHLRIQALPSAEVVLTGCTACRTGDALKVLLNLKNPGDTAIPVEIKLGVVLPNQSPVNIVDQHLTVSLPAAFSGSVPILEMPITTAFPVGAWHFKATVLEPSLATWNLPSLGGFTVE